MSESDIPDLRGGVKETWREGDIAECIVTGMQCFYPGVEAPKKGQRFIVETIFEGVAQAAWDNLPAHIIGLQFEGQPPDCVWLAGNFRKRLEKPVAMGVAS